MSTQISLDSTNWRIASDGRDVSKLILPEGTIYFGMEDGGEGYSATLWTSDLSTMKRTDGQIVQLENSEKSAVQHFVEQYLIKNGIVFVRDTEITLEVPKDAITEKELLERHKRGEL